MIGLGLRQPPTLEQLRAVKLWHAEGQYSTSQPPDINYKELIDTDDAIRMWILENEKMGPLSDA